LQRGGKIHGLEGTPNGSIPFGMSRSDERPQNGGKDEDLITEKLTTNRGEKPMGKGFKGDRPVLASMKNW